METDDQSVKNIKQTIGDAVFPEVEIETGKVPGGKFVGNMVLSRVYPHKNSGGVEHKGNMNIYWANLNGNEASAKCVVCGMVVRLKIKKP